MGSRYMFLLLVVLLLVGTCCCSSSTSISISWGGCPPEERSALLRLKQELADPFDGLISWKGLYCCSWLGITCHRVSGHVARLHLRGPLSAAVKNSSSQIFPALFQLHHLEYLDLSRIDLSPLPFPSHLPMTLTRLTHLSFRGCGLTGRIPSEIGNMSTFEYLDISYNPDLMGQIPSEIGNLSSLKYLDIYHDPHLELSQSGSWLRNLRGLEELCLYDVNVTSTGGDGALVESVASLTNLTTLWLSGVSGTTLSPLVNLTSLSDLSLIDSDVARQTFPIWISNLTSLVTLGLYNYSLRGSIPSTLLALPHLRNLGLSYNPNLKVNLSSIVQHASQLSTLYIFHSNVGGVIPNSIGNMSSLTRLSLRNNKIEGIIPPAVGNMSSLTALDLSYNSLRGPIPWSYLGGLSKLSHLDLESNQLNGSLPSTLNNLSSVEILFLSNNYLSGTFLLSQLDGLTKIRFVDLSNNFLTIGINSNWIPKFQLESLLLTSCNMHGGFPSFISTQYSISEIDLSNNSLSGNIPEWLSELTLLQTLNLSYNQFEGLLPTKFSAFGAQYLDLHRNKLQGNIHVPHPNVQFLDMSENQFEGINKKNTEKYTISQLIYLSLANNSIKGVFPHSICKGPSLEVLDVSNNKFEGNLLASFGNCSLTLKVLNLFSSNINVGIQQTTRANSIFTSRLYIFTNFRFGIQ